MRKSIEMRCSAIAEVSAPNLVAGDPVFVQASFLQVRSTSRRHSTRKPKPGDWPDTIDDMTVTLRHGDIEVGQHVRMTVNPFFVDDEETSRESD